MTTPQEGVSTEASENSVLWKTNPFLLSENCHFQESERKVLTLSVLPAVQTQGQVGLQRLPT